MSEQVPFSEEQVAGALGLFLPAGGVVEVRALGVERGGTVSGYFDDREAALAAAGQFAARAEGVYVTLNPVDAACLARANNRLRTFARTTTTDDDIVERRWLFVDLDSVRPRGVSATEAEFRAALQRAREVRAFLREVGWPAPVVAHSGNGAHLLYRLRAANSTEARDLCHQALRVLSARFSDGAATVDPATFNAARIIRLYGTAARKGDPMDDRPHRLSRILVGGLDVAQGRPLTLEELREFVRAHGAGLNADEPGRRLERPTGGPLGQAAPPRARGLDFAEADVVAWFRAHESYGHLADEARGMHTVRCPWEDEHSAGDGAHDTDTVVFDGTDGTLPNFRCQHAHCVSRRLREVAAEWGDAEQFGARVRTRGDYSLTDEGNAARFVDRFGEHVRFAPELGGWHFWDGARWAGDANEVEPVALMGQVVRELGAEAEQVGEGERREQVRKWAVQSQKWERRRSQLALASKARELQARADWFDANPWLLNCQNGVVDLRTGELRPPTPSVYSSHIAPHNFDPEARCPRWDQFLGEVFAGDEELVAFVWRAIGYSLTGSTREQVLFFCHGFGANGKSTFLEVLLHVLGTYGGAAAPGLLLESRTERHPTEIADLRGRRAVACVEVGEGRRFAEETVKRLTGGDLLKARMMRRDFFEFRPTHKLWVAANHKPIVRGTDEAIWRRLPLIPFEVTFRDPEVARPGQPVKDKALFEKLQREATGILARAVRAAGEWFRDGLNPPAVVLAATADYRAEQDLLGAFIEECCEVGEHEWDTAGALYATYRRWCEDAGERPATQRAFGLALRERGFERRKVSTFRWVGLRALSEEERTAREVAAR